jgi:uncharacterized repeat protein (TIGR03803 family)
LVHGGGVWNENILYNFDANDGGPQGVVEDASGNLYGVKADIFEVSPPAVTGGPWTETTVYTFTGKGDGASPAWPLWRDKLGDLYGAAASGDGWCGGFWCGSVFKLKAPATVDGSWTLQVLHDFRGGNGDGSTPQAGVIFFNGALYGTTFWGGDAGGGTVYRVVP